MLRAMVCLLSAMAVTLAAYPVELYRGVPDASMLVTLTPGASKALVQELRLMEYAGPMQSVFFSYGQATIAPDSIRISPPPGVTVQRSYRPADRDNCVVWELVGSVTQASPTRISYELEGLKWQLLYRLEFWPSSRTARVGKAFLGAEIEMSNGSGLDLDSAAVTVALSSGEDDTYALQVAGEPRNLPAGWTKQWPLVDSGQAFGIAADLPATVRYVYAPHLYGQRVQRLLVITEPPQSPRSLRLLGLPEGPTEVFLSSDTDQPDLVPSAFTTWRSQAEPSLSAITAGYMTFELGPEPAILVEDTVTALRKQNVTLDSQGRVSGMDVVEEYRYTVTNRTGHGVELALYQELLSKWKLQVTAPLPDPGVEPPEDRAPSQAVLWEGMLQRAQTLVVEFVLTKRQGAAP